MSRFYFIFSLILLSLIGRGQSLLSEESTISVYTCGPGEDLYTLFGHTAIRVHDPLSDIDVVYNYGTFDFDAPGFMFKFLRGQLPYQLSKTSVTRFLNEYYYYQRYVKEQYLELSPIQKNEIYRFLENNVKPENREYAYDFYFDNCTTRIRDIFSTIANAEYPDLIYESYTFRDLLHQYNEKHAWTKFGMDIILGTTNDLVTTDQDRMFLPEYFFNYLETATNKSINQTLVKETSSVLQFPVVESRAFLLPPNLTFSLILFLEMFVSFLLLKKPHQKFAKTWDSLWFGALFICFAVFFFMWFFTNHIVCSNNWNLIWTIPWMIFAIYSKSSLQRTIAKMTVFYCSLLLLTWTFIPQYMCSTSLLIVLISMIKSLRLGNILSFIKPNIIAIVSLVFFSISAISAQEKIAGITLVSPPRAYELDPMPELKQINANWVALVPFGFTPLGSPEVRFGSENQWWGERIEGIEKSIELARKSGLKVMLKPQVWIRGGWVGDMDFDNEADWKIWEDSYREYILSLIDIAENHKVDLFCIGTEYRMSVVKREAFWRDLIKQVRKKYTGKITYSANWDSYDEVPIWDALDYVGISAYFPLTDMDTPPTLYLSFKWRKVVRKLRNFYNKHNRKILFTEYGYLAVDGAAGKTWELEKDMHSLPVNEQAQANGYEALINAFIDEEFWAGGFLWKWFPKGYGREERTHVDYTPQGKKGQNVIAEKYAKLSAQ